jgi:hypothetical protein
MTGHNAIGIYFQPFLLLTMSETIQNNMPVLIPYKYIDPVDCRKAYKVKFAAITKLIFPAHIAQIL